MIPVFLLLRKLCLFKELSNISGIHLKYLYCIYYSYIEVFDSETVKVGF